MSYKYILLCVLLLGCKKDTKDNLINQHLIQNNESLSAIIAAIKLKGIHNKQIVTDEELAQNLLISKEQLAEYLNGDKHVPDGLVFKLITCYKLQLMVFEARETKNIHVPVRVE